MALTKADVAGGGTGTTSLTDHGVLLGSGTGAVSATGAGTSGQVLASGGSGADPDWAAAPQAQSAVLDAVAAGTDITVAQGGTGVSTLTDDGVLIGSGTGVIRATDAGTAGEVMTSGGAGVAPDWAAAGGGISDWDQWRLTTSYTAGTGYTYLTTNLERNDTSGFAKLGTGMTNSTGVFTFPATGYWSVYFQINTNVLYGGHVTENAYIWYTADSWSSQSVSSQSSGYGYYSEAQELTVSSMFYITDTTNQQVKFGRYSPKTTTVEASTNENITFVNFIRHG